MTITHETMRASDVTAAAKHAVTAATRRFRPEVWAFMAPDIAADIKVAFAIQHVVAEATSSAVSTSSQTIRDITSAIQTVVYGPE